MSQSQKRPVPRTRPAKPVRDLPLLSRMVLFFTPCRRKILGFAGLVATWLLLGLVPPGPGQPASGTASWWSSAAGTGRPPNNTRGATKTP